MKLLRRFWSRRSSPWNGSETHRRKALTSSAIGAAARAATGYASAFVLLAGCAPNLRPIATVADSAWTLVWSDEFDGRAGNGVDTTRWNYDYADGCPVGICGWGNNEKEYYSDSTSSISLNGKGQLVITARKAAPGLICYYGPCLYTSAKITTRGKLLASPGRVEARIKLPSGQGLWPAFWMLGHGNPITPWPDCGELDIMENKGSQFSTTSSAIHGPGYSGNTPFAHSHDLGQAKLSDDFHVFAIEWDSSHARFFVDDTPHYDVTREAIEKYGRSILDQPFFIILNLAVGGHFDGDPKSDDIFPATMLVDYVRVYVARPK
jgi:beta-glucanase (GH16 family)